MEWVPLAYPGVPNRALKCRSASIQFVALLTPTDAAPLLGLMTHAGGKGDEDSSKTGPSAARDIKNSLASFQLSVSICRMYDDGKGREILGSFCLPNICRFSCSCIMYLSRRPSLTPLEVRTWRSWAICSATLSPVSDSLTTATIEGKR